MQSGLKRDITTASVSFTLPIRVKYISVILSILFAGLFIVGFRILTSYLIDTYRLKSLLLELKGKNINAYPLYAMYDPNITSKIILPFLFAPLLFYVIHTVLKRGIKNSNLILALLVLSSFLLNLCVASVDGDFVQVITKTFQRDKLEYYGDVGKVNGEFIFDYESRLKDLSLHSSTHPPGPILFLWCLSRLGLDAFWSSLFVAIFGSLTVVPIYRITRRLYGEKGADLICVLYILSPNVVLYSVTSMDVMFMFTAALSALYFFKCLEKFKLLNCLVFALLYSTSLFMTFTNGLLVIFFLMVVWLTLNRSDVQDKVDIYRSLFLMGWFVLLIHIVLLALFNYNIAEVFFKANEYNRQLKAPYRPYGYWIFGNWADFFTFLGIPVAGFVVHYCLQILQDIKGKVLRRENIPFISIVAALLLIDISGIIRGEAGRIWLFASPVLFISIANFVEEVTSDSNVIVYVIVGMLFIQTLAMEVMYETYW